MQVKKQIQMPVVLEAPEALVVLEALALVLEKTL
jgi:hypothetical protein